MVGTALQGVRLAFLLPSRLLASLSFGWVDGLGLYATYALRNV